MKLRFTFIILFFIPILTKAQIAAPNLLCVKRDTLIWTNPSVSCGAVNAYRILAARNINGPYQELVSIRNLSQTRYFHNNTEGGRWYYYMETDANCAGQAALTSDTLDNEPPLLTAISTLNVIDSKTVEVRWRKNASPEVVGYIIYKKTNTGLIPIANINNRDTTRYVDANASPSIKTEEYQVLAIDACGNTSLFDVNHQTLLVKATQSKCDQSVTLKWNLYKNWTNSIGKQEVWVGVAGRTPSLFATLGNKDTVFVYKNGKDKVKYNFFIKAVESFTNISSKSNDTLLTGDFIEPVRTLVLKAATVNNANKVELVWRWNEDARVDTVRILRGERDSALSVIKAIKPKIPLDDEATFLDTAVNAALKPYVYQVKTKDDCKVDVSSNTFKTVHLQGAPQAGRRNNLNWTPLGIPNGTVVNYQVIRIVNGAASNAGNPILTASPLEYTDIATPDEQEVCYRVAALYKYKLPDNTEEEAVAYSNSICLNQNVGLWIPNAFTPNGYNPEFKPLVTYPSAVKDYTLIIADRWGGKIFESKDPNVGWTGKRGDTDMPPGTYLYFIRIKQASGDLLENKGMVMLIR